MKSDRPKTLPVTKQKAHVRSLIKEHGLKVKWGGFPHYDAPEQVVYLPWMRTDLDYIICLHEIGHALDPRIEELTSRVQRLKLEADGIEEFVASDEKTTCGELNYLYKRMQQISQETTARSKAIGSPLWLWKNERIAWQYAFRNALLWNDVCTQHVVQGMNRYYWGSQAAKNHIGDGGKHYHRFVMHYVRPIFQP